MHLPDSLIHTAVKPPAAGILMSAPVKEPGRHIVAREIIHAAQTHLHYTLMLRILAQEYAQPHPGYLQRHIRNTLRIPVLNAEQLTLLIRQRDDTGIYLRNRLHLHIQQIAG